MFLLNCKTWQNLYLKVNRYSWPKNEWKDDRICTQTKVSLFNFGEQDLGLKMRKFCNRVGFYKSRESKLQRFNSDFNIQLGMVCLQQNQKGSLAEGRAKCFTADSAQKLGSKTTLTNCQFQQSNRSKYPIKTITWF